MRSMDNGPQISYGDLEVLRLRDNGKVIHYKPVFSTKQALDYFEEIISSIKRSKISCKKFGYNLLPAIYEDLFWKHCFNYIKYKPLFDQYGFSSRFDIDSSSKWQMSGYSRAVQIFRGDPIHVIIKLCIHKIIFILWLAGLLFKGKKRQIWIDQTILNNHRYNVTEFVDKHSVLPILNRWCSVRSIKRPKQSIEGAVESLIQSRFGSYRYWKIAIYLLKPKRIILKDNLCDNSSLLLASKLMGVSVIGVSHGLVSFWHRGLFGSSHFFGDETQIRYDKYFAWTNQMRQLLLAKGSIYKRQEVSVSGWLRKLPSSKNGESNSSSKFVLYPFEWISNHGLMLDYIDLLIDRGFDIVVKEHPDLKPNSSIRKRKIQFVSDYSVEHYRNCLFVIASTTTMAIELSFIGSPVLICNNDGFNMFAGQTYPNWIKFDNASQLFAAVELIENGKTISSKLLAPLAVDKSFRALFQ